MFVLMASCTEYIQEFIGENFERCDGPDERVAFFTTEKKANLYIKKAKLKAANNSPVNEIWGKAKDLLFEEDTFAKQIISIVNKVPDDSIITTIKDIANPWLQEIAFESLIDFCTES